MLPIEKDVPIPESAKGPRRIYPYRTMQVGDSFYVPGDKKKVASVRNMASNQWKQSTGFRFSTRSEPGGCRVWRVE